MIGSVNLNKSWAKKLTFLKVVVTVAFSFSFGYTASTITHQENDEYHLHVTLDINGQHEITFAEGDSVVTITSKDGSQWNIWWPMKMRAQVHTIDSKDDDDGSID